MAGKDLPAWARRPFEEYLDLSEKLHEVLHLSMEGIARLRALPDLERKMAYARQVLAETASARGSTASPEHADVLVPSEVQEQRLKSAERLADLALREVDDEFPILHGQAVVSLWTALESLSRNALTAWLDNDPKEIWKHERLRKMKVALSEYQGLAPEEQSAYVAEMVERELGSPLGLGIGRFEGIFDVVGLAGVVEEGLRRDILELGNVRNALVHRGGVADRRLVETCPWLGLRLGDPVKVSHSRFCAYYSAAHDYVLERIQRMRVHFGLCRYEAPSGATNVPPAPAAT